MYEQPNKQLDLKKTTNLPYNRIPRRKIKGIFFFLQNLVSQIRSVFATFFIPRPYHDIQFINQLNVVVLDILDISVPSNKILI